MLTLERQGVQNVCAPAKKIITPEDLINDLSGIVESRFKAVSMYPYAKSATDRFAAIQLIRAELAAAKASLNWKDKIKICLRLENRFLFLAPTSTYKLFETYTTRIHAYMNSCRECLNWRVQQ